MVEYVEAKGQFDIKVNKKYQGIDNDNIFLDYIYKFSIVRCYPTKKNTNSVQSDRIEEEMFPMVARLRDLTYSR